MSAVRIGEGFIEVNGEKLPLLACEFHYWRNKQEYWRDILKKIKDAGFTVVTSFVQPNLHEYEPGKFDFVGKTSPQRDVVKFLRLCKEVGLYAHLRPGPACCEWRESGGTFFGTNWLEFADQFAEAVKDEQVTEGGALLLIQVHNEWFDLMASHWILWALADFDGFDAPKTYEQVELVGPNCHYISAGETYHPELLLDYLRWRYGDIERLNDNWRTNYSSFQEILDEILREGGDTVAGFMDYVSRHFYSIKPSDNLYPLFDLIDWYKKYMGFALRKYTDHIRKHLQLPLTHNWPMGREDIYNQIAGLDLSGYDHYRTTWDDIWDWVSLAADYCENRFPFSGEFMCGTIERYMWGGQGWYTPNIARLFILSHFAEGLRGINLYMFVERDNWLQCPIDRRGGLRETYHTIKGIMHALKELRWHERRIPCDIAVIRCAEYQNYTCQGVPENFSHRGFYQKWILENIYMGIDPKLSFNNLHNTLHREKFEFMTYKAEYGALTPRDEKVWIVFSMPFMHAEHIKAIEKHVESGNWVLLYPYPPIYNLKGEKSPLFPDVEVSAKGEFEGGIVFNGRTYKAEPYKGADYLFTLSGEGEKIENTAGETIGLIKRQGDGGYILLGFDPTLCPEFLSHLLELTGCKRYILLDASEGDGCVGLLEGEEPAIILYNGEHKKEVKSFSVLKHLLPEQGRSISSAKELLTGKEYEAHEDGEYLKFNIELPPRDAGIFLLQKTPPSPKIASAKERTVPLTSWQLRWENISDYAYYILGEGDDWCEIPAGEWTAPVITKCCSLGVQGWFWFTARVNLPDDRPIYFRLRVSGWHVCAVLYINGKKVAVERLARPSSDTVIDVSDYVKRGENTVAIRFYRQSLDCHDRGSASLEGEFFSLTWSKKIEKWLFKQEELLLGEALGWHKGEFEPMGRVNLPATFDLIREEQFLWLKTKFNWEGGEPPFLLIEGKDGITTVYLNGEYLTTSPYLPANFHLTSAKEGENTLVLRLAADDFTTYDMPRNARYAKYIEQFLLPAKLEISKVEVHLP